MRIIVILALGVLAIGATFLLFSPNVIRGSGPIATTNLSEEELIARGEYLTVAGNCASCHTTSDGEFMAGGLSFATPFGTLYSTNITPDPETGIGNWSDWDFLNSMRHGVRPNGEHLYPAFPYTSFTKVPNEDVAAMFAYLRSIPPIKKDARTNELSFPFKSFRSWAAPNLTPSKRGLGLWPQSALEDYLKTARNDFLESFGPMNEVIMNSTRYLSGNDITAMATYLKSLPIIDEHEGVMPDSELMGRGRTIYNLHCGTCHLPTGEGDPEMAPRLNAGSLVVQAENPASMINAILYSPETPGHPLTPRWREAMEEFQYLLNDEEVAAVTSYIRNSWSNRAGLVSSEQVALQR